MAGCDGGDRSVGAGEHQLSGMMGLSDERDQLLVARGLSNRDGLRPGNDQAKLGSAPDPGCGQGQDDLLVTLADPGYLVPKLPDTVILANDIQQEPNLAFCGLNHIICLI